MTHIKNIRGRLKRKQVRDIILKRQSIYLLLIIQIFVTTNPLGFNSGHVLLTYIAPTNKPEIKNNFKVQFWPTRTYEQYP